MLSGGDAFMLPARNQSVLIRGVNDEPERWVRGAAGDGPTPPNTGAC